MIRRVSSFRLVAPLVLLLGAGCATAPRDAEGTRALVEAARATLERFVADPDLAGFRATLAEARGVLIVPEENRGGFILGGSGGVGVLVARDAARGDWAGPAFYGIGSASIGLQIGGSRSEVILLVMSQRALDALFATTTKLGGEVSVAAGPIGTGAGDLGIDIASYARARGLFAGISLEGSLLRPAEARNRAFYGQPVTPLDILVRRTVEPGAGAALVADVAAAAR